MRTGYSQWKTTDCTATSVGYSTATYSTTVQTGDDDTALIRFETCSGTIEDQEKVTDEPVPVENTRCDLSPPPRQPIKPRRPRQPPGSYG